MKEETETAEVLGAVIGLDETRIAARLAERKQSSYGDWFDNLDNSCLSAQSSMLLLTKCGAGKLNSLSRVTLPAAFQQHAVDIDQRIFKSATAKLGIKAHAAAHLQLSLPARAGGWGLTRYHAHHRINYFSSLSICILHDSLGTFEELDADQIASIDTMLATLNEELDARRRRRGGESAQRLGCTVGVHYRQQGSAWWRRPRFASATRSADQGSGQGLTQPRAQARVSTDSRHTGPPTHQVSVAQHQAQQQLGHVAAAC